MSDLAEWLAARLAEVEARAKAAEAIAASPWKADSFAWRDEKDMVFAASPVRLGYSKPAYELWATEDDVWGSEAVAAHVAGFHPAMALQLVAATRQVLEMHAGNHECVSEDDNCAWVTEAACATVKALAAGWGWTETEES